jgi:hypothetical protein
VGLNTTVVTPPGGGEAAVLSHGEGAAVAPGHRFAILGRENTTSCLVVATAAKAEGGTGAAPARPQPPTPSMRRGAAADEGGGTLARAARAAGEAVQRQGQAGGADNGKRPRSNFEEVGSRGGGGSAGWETPPWEDASAASAAAAAAGKRQRGDSGGAGVGEAQLLQASAATDARAADEEPWLFDDCPLKLFRVRWAFRIDALCCPKRLLARQSAPLPLACALHACHDALCGGRPMHAMLHCSAMPYQPCLEPPRRPSRDLPQRDNVGALGIRLRDLVAGPMRTAVVVGAHVLACMRLHGHMHAVAWTHARMHEHRSLRTHACMHLALTPARVPGGPGLADAFLPCPRAGRTPTPPCAPPARLHAVLGLAPVPNHLRRRHDAPAPIR